MKNVFRFLGIVAFMAIIGFSITACNRGRSGNNTSGSSQLSGSNQFSGTSWDTTSGGEYIILSFTDSEFMFEFPFDRDSDQSGIYTVQGNTATLNMDDRTLISTISRNSLSVSTSGGSNLFDLTRLEGYETARSSGSSNSGSGGTSGVSNDSIFEFTLIDDEWDEIYNGFLTYQHFDPYPFKGTYSVYIETEQSGTFEIPASYQGKPVTVIDSVRAQNIDGVRYSKITGVIIPDSVIYIGDYAFNECDSLTSVTIPNNVLLTARNAFSTLPNLASVTIANTDNRILGRAFSSCDKLTSVTFETVQTRIFSGIATDAFDGDLIHIINSRLYGGGGAGTYTRDAGGEEWTKR